MSERERMQHEIERLNTEFTQARTDEQTRDDQRKQELDVLQSSVSKHEEKFDKIIKKEREKTTLTDEDERKLEKINVYLCFRMRFHVLFLVSFRQIDRDKKTLVRYDQQRTRDAEMLRTVTENLQRAFYTNDSIGTDMKRETEKLKKEEDAIRVKSYVSRTSDFL